ncbi:MAG: sigma-54-dependent transcriptional regulator [Desulfovibrio sp.]|uniref:sigma-54-dependent transcriptional regulator n=1 Tax=Desulfovibrio sp. 7SRBS1 TaxID=3378064 RepID=UPI003B40C59A
MSEILLIDDDKAICQAIAMVLRSAGLKSGMAHTLKEGRDLARQNNYDVVVLDVMLPDGNGLGAIPDLRQAPSQPEIIILTGAGDPDGAELAIRSGAWDYITKPPTMNKIKLTVQRALDYHESKRRRTPPVLKRCGIIGESAPMRDCLDQVSRAAASDGEVLITGSTGTGKELFAKAIHVNSNRSEGDFIVVDCAALPEKLVESMLFGHERGAFTGADKRFDGLIRKAHKGTLFLDEVGELPLPTQRAFLRVLQEHTFKPVGSTEEVGSDFRVVAATNRNLDEMVAKGMFRKDLLFRLRTIHIGLPELKDRPEDIHPLISHYVSRRCWKLSIPNKRCSPEFVDALRQYSWPGNVRELIGALTSSIATASDDPVLFARHLPTDIRASAVRSTLQAERQGGEVCANEDCAPLSLTHGSPEDFPRLKDFREATIHNAERNYLRHLLALTEGKIAAACNVSGLSRARLYALLKKYGLRKHP